MKLNKLLSLLLALLLMTAPALAEAAPEVVEEAPATYAVEARTFPYLHQFDANNDPEEGEMTLYFVNGSDIPYVALDEYAAFLTGVLAEMGKEGIEYKVEAHTDDEFSISREDNGSAMFVNTEKDVLFFLNLNGFTQPVGSRAAVTVMDLPEAEPISLDELTKTVLNMWKLMNGEEMTVEDMVDDSSDAPEEESGEDDTEGPSEAEAESSDSTLR